ncbi:MAG: hypothetical protein K6A35_09940, partial [bacterium]|nr:hypothetical protein [bacterium]
SVKRFTPSQVLNILKERAIRSIQTLTFLLKCTFSLPQRAGTISASSFRNLFPAGYTGHLHKLYILTTAILFSNSSRLAL